MTDLLIQLFIKNADDIQNPSVRAKYGFLASVMGVVCNAVLCVSKIVVGFFAGSISIMADGLNNLSDAAANITSLIGFKMAEKPADAEHPFGHARSEYVSGFVVALLILVIGVELFRSSVQKIINPTAVTFNVVLVGVLAFSILVKCWMSAFNKKIGELITSSTLKATAQDSLNDVYTTIAVLIGVLVGHFTGVKIDGYMGVLVAIFILYSGYSLVKETLSPIIGQAPDAELTEMIKREIETEPLILNIHDLIVHDYGPGHRFASVHVEINSEVDVLKAHAAIDELERLVLEKQGVHLVIHYDPVLLNDPYTQKAYDDVNAIVKSIDKTLSIHDLRTVQEKGKTKVLFDVEKPFDFKTNEENLIAEITEKMLQAYINYLPVITIDNIDIEK